MYLAEGDRGMNSEVVGITETVLADPSKVRLILELPDTIHLSFENFLGEVSVESLDDSIDLLPLERAELGDGNAFERNDPVVLSGTTEVPAKKKIRKGVHKIVEADQLTFRQRPSICARGYRGHGPYPHKAEPTSGSPR